MNLTLPLSQKKHKALPLSLYVHVPWCIKKCPYCDFNSHEVGSAKNNVSSPSASQRIDPALEQHYYLQLVGDLRQELAEYRALNHSLGSIPLQSIFFGGGTPSLLSPNFFAKIIEIIFQEFDGDTKTEITLEANPGTAEAGRFKGYREAGINRLSLGVQSFDERQLKALGRIHSSRDALDAFDMARRAGFSNINIDIMYGLPAQTVESALSDLREGVALGSEHLSWYQLTIEKNTAFYSDPPLLPKEDPIEMMFVEGAAALHTAGFTRYEVSAYARDDKESVHNNNYWAFGDYMGIGAGAHSKISGDSVIKRRWKTRAPKDYLEKEKMLAGESVIGEAERPMEFMMNALRLKRGFTPMLFEERTRLPYQIVEQTISELIEKGLILQEGGRICTSEVGMHYLDSVLAEF